MEKRTTLYVDGGCSGNQQTDYAARTMYAVVTDEHGTVLIEKVKYGGGSNNVAELWAVAEALHWCLGHREWRVHIMTDSRNNLSWIYKRVKATAQVNNREAVWALQDEVQSLLQAFGPDAVSVEWVPRDQNKAGQYLEGRYCL